MSFLPALLTAAAPRKSDRGVTMVEYGILVAVIALVVIVGATVFGAALSTFFNGLGAKL